MRCIALLTALLLPGLVAGADDAPKPPSKEGIAFFETHIRPVLAEHCYACHSAQAKTPKGGLRLDTQPNLAKGGDSGPALVPGDAAKSRLITAIRWTDADMAMPPKTQLTPQQIEKFEQWVAMGAPDPRTDGAAVEAKPARAIDLEAGRQWWAFQPVVELTAPGVNNAAWPRKKIDSFILKELESKNIAPSIAADPRILIQRIYLNLTGLRPTYEQVEGFVREHSDAAYEHLVERLLASPQYGQRWGRYWLDVARYGEDNTIGGPSNAPYPYAWRYRDWVIQALNDDVPYNRFVTLQLAADRMPKTPRSDLAATGFLGAAPVEHKDCRLSKDVIETFYMEDWDERIDVVTRGILGLTVACARCHDHKFDPVRTRDYYSLAGVFASTFAAPRPLAEIDPAVEAQFLVTAQRLFYINYVANLLRNEPGSDPKASRRTVEKFVLEMDKIITDIEPLKESAPDLHAYLVRLYKKPAPYDKLSIRLPMPNTRRNNFANEPFIHSVYEAAVQVDGSDPELTMIGLKPGQPRDLTILRGGNVAKPGDPAPRGFPAVLAKGDPAFHNGSGRLELAERIFTDAAPLAARVIVNRVWAWHFGKPLVETQSDFGTQGDKPTHPQLLDDLAARFIARGWSLKWLHREILLSATYRQASRTRPDAAKSDPANRLLWRMNPRRLDIEAYRDNLLQSTGSLDTSLGGPSADIDPTANTRRTVYARITRSRINGLLQLYGFPEPTMHSPGRETTTSPLQQLFVMNSAFLRDRATALAESVGKEPDGNIRLNTFYRNIYQRNPTDHERSLAGNYLTTGTLTDYAHALLSTNEMIYWP